MAANSVTQKRRDLAKLLDELETIQEEMDTGPISHARGEEAEEKANEAERLQQAIHLEETLAQAGRTPVHPVVPRRSQPNGRGAERDGGEGGPEAPVAYTTVGEKFVASREFQGFVELGAPKGDSAPMALKSLDPRVPLTRDQLAEMKALPSWGADVLLPERIADRVRVPERTRLRLRDVLTVAGTTAAAVSYVVYSYVENAQPTPEAKLKPESAIGFGTALAPVRTIAVWMPVTEQMLEDFPALSGTIDSELLYDVRRAEELQILHGDGEGENLLGLLSPKTEVPTIPDPKRPAPANPQILDLVRQGITDVTLRGGEPNAILMHPIDWEAAELLKATDAKYLWAIIRDQLGPRLWSLPVVESVHLANPADQSRQFVVGDFARGATLFDRRAAGISVGWINDQFVKNTRTIRAEERIAFAIKRPHLLAKGTAPVTP